MKIQDKTTFDAQNVFGLGNENSAFAQYFIGTSYLNPLTAPNESSVFLANVTFEPGCRNNWHIHHAAEGGGQILICTAGEGWYQEAGKDPVSLTPGSVIVIHQKSNTGMAPKPTAGFPISRLKYQARKRPTNGANLLMTRPSPNLADTEVCHDE